MTRYLLTKATAGFVLLAGLFLLSGWEEMAQAGTKEEAQRAVEDFRAAKDAKSKAAALEQLGKYGQIQKTYITTVVVDMMKCLEDKDPIVRGAAAKAVGMIDPEPKEVIPIFTKMMKEDKEESVKLAAIQGLASMGPNAKDAIKDLKQIVKDEDKKSKLSRAAQNAVKMIAPKKT
jgi:HEAT repeat protein